MLCKAAGDGQNRPRPAGRCEACLTPMPGTFVIEEVPRPKIVAIAGAGGFDPYKD